MKIRIKYLLFIISLLGSVSFAILGFSFPVNKVPVPAPNNWIESEAILIKTQAPNIDNKVLKLALTAYQKARQRGVSGKPILTVIDYTKPSTQKRMWVFDLQKGRTLFNTWVSHGKNSGDVNATSFSNIPGSLKSAIGVFVTGSPYIGKNGYSLHMQGLEYGFNNNAFNRSIVIHGAAYVNPDTIRRYGRIGRSWGCPAVSKSLSRSLIDTIKGKSLIFAYYPDRKWLSTSQFLKL